ncbi:type II secretion system F family protein [soil metagenome]
MGQLPKTMTNRPAKVKPSNRPSASTLFSKKISDKSLSEFTRHLSVMVRSSIPLVKALEGASSQISDARFKKIVDQLIKDVKGGKSLASAMKKHPSAFDGLYVNLVKTGETAGILGQVLHKLTGYLEKRTILKQKAKKALTYPLFVLSVSAVVLLFLLIVIVPTFAEMYADYDAELPEATQAVIWVSNVLSGNILWIATCAIIMIICCRAFFRSPKGRKINDYMILQAPLIKTFNKKRYVTRFCQILGTLLNNGVNMVDALTITKKSSNNYYIEQAVDEMLRSVKRGKSLAGSVTKTGYFPPIVIQMITVGEETSELPKMLLEIADSNQREIDNDLDTLASILEPALIVIIGIVIGIVIVAMYLPIFELMNVVQ